MGKFASFITAESENDSKISDLIDGKGLILFFEKDKDIFGCDEDSRVLFAKMKNPKDEDLPDKWDEEASFSAHNLSRAVHGEPTHNIFNKKDFKSIKVIDKEKAEEKLISLAKKLGDKAFPKGDGHAFQVMDLSKIFKKKDPDEAPNFVRADEE